MADSKIDLVLILPVCVRQENVTLPDEDDGEGFVLDKVGAVLKATRAAEKAVSEVLGDGWDVKTGPIHGGLLEVDEEAGTLTTSDGFIDGPVI